jgi:hypothetical protein
MAAAYRFAELNCIQNPVDCVPDVIAGLKREGDPAIHRKEGRFLKP